MKIELLEPFLEKRKEETKLVIETRSWVAKILWKLLNKFSIKFYRNRTSIAYKTFETETIKEKIRLTDRQLRLLWDREAKYLVVGRNEYIDLLDEFHDQFIRFNSSCEIGINNDIRVFGLKVIVVPWIEGICVLPEIK